MGRNKRMQGVGRTREDNVVGRGLGGESGWSKGGGGGGWGRGIRTGR